MSRDYLRYSDAVEVVPPDEEETIAKILQSMHRLFARTREQYGRPIRVSHAKSHGVAVGEMVVLGGLLPHLRQGLFARPARYPVIVRLANVPGELLGDQVITQSGFAFKILGVEGEMLPGHAGEVTQDFVLDTGNRFAAADAKAFLLTHRGLEHAPQMPEVLKAGMAQASRLANKALHAMGGDSPRLDFFGHPRIHPLAEAYFSQAAIRYGDFIAKLVVVPTGLEQQKLDHTALDTKRDRDALRTATTSFLREHDAVFEVRVQLCTDLQRMPVEDASVEWSEAESPYQPVARITLPRQEAYSAARRAYVDEALAFCVSHCLAAHRPLGGIMRARLRAYPEMSRLRREAGGQPLAEPRSIAEVPA